MSDKTEIIKSIFDMRWDSVTSSLSDTVVTLSDIQNAITEFNESTTGRKMSPRNPANFFKDFVRSRPSANRNWPTTVLSRGYTGRQLTGESNCFEFVPLIANQVEPFPDLIQPPAPHTPRVRLESASLPLASRRLGRPDETWLMQVAVRLHLIETHLSLFSSRNIVQVDHLQIGIKQARTEIDALFLAIEETSDGKLEEIVVSCEAKGKRDNILPDQIMSQVKAVFAMTGLTQDLVLPVAVKAIGPSEVWLVEFSAVDRSAAGSLNELTVASDAIYEFVPPIPGIGA